MADRFRHYSSLVMSIGLRKFAMADDSDATFFAISECCMQYSAHTLYIMLAYTHSRKHI